MLDDHRVHHIEPVAMRLHGLAVWLGHVPTTEAPTPRRRPGHTHIDATDLSLVNVADTGHNICNAPWPGKTRQHVLKIDVGGAAPRPEATQPLLANNEEFNLRHRHPANSDGDVLGVLFEDAKVPR